MMAELIRDLKKPSPCRVVKLASVTGLRNFGGTAAASTWRLNAVSRIHANGTATRTRPMLRSAYLSTSRPLLRFTWSPFSLSARASGSAPEDQVEQSYRDRDHDDQQHAHGGGVADLVVEKPRVVDLQVQRGTGDSGPAGGENLNALELAETLDEPQQHGDEQHGAHAGQCDVPEHLQAVRS